MYSRRAARDRRRAVERLAELRREDDAVAPVAEDLADELLARAHGVDVGGVEERDARVERGVDHRARLREVGARAEVVAAESDDGDLGAAVSE